MSDVIAEPKSPTPALLWSLFIVAIAVLADLVLAEITARFENILETKRGGAAAPARRSLLDLVGSYQWVVTVGPRKPVARYTTVVVIEPSRLPHVPSLNNVCEQREFLAHLVTRLAGAGVGAIVLDKYFDPDTCPGDARSELLTASIRGASRSTPIVVGTQLVDIPSDEDSAGDRRHFRLTPSLIPAAANVSFGNVKIHADDRRLALGWPILAGDGTRREWNIGLALATATAFRPALLEKDHWIARIVERKVSPYASFIPLAEMDRVSAVDVLCGGTALDVAEWRGCLERDPAAFDPVLLRALRTTVAVVGEVHPSIDVHSSVIGAVPGVFLQANLIEALLDGRVLAPLPGWIDAAFGALIAFGCAFTVEYYGRTRLGPMFAVLLGVFVSTVTIVFALAIFCGRYANPLFVSLTGVVLLALGQVVRFVLARRENPFNDETKAPEQAT